MTYILRRFLSKNFSCVAVVVLSNSPLLGIVIRWIPNSESSRSSPSSVLASPSSTQNFSSARLSAFDHTIVVMIKVVRKFFESILEDFVSTGIKLRHHLRIAINLSIAVDIPNQETITCSSNPFSFFFFLTSFWSPK